MKEWMWRRHLVKESETQPLPLSSGPGITGRARCPSWAPSPEPETRCRLRLSRTARRKVGDNTHTHTHAHINQIKDFNQTLQKTLGLWSVVMTVIDQQVRLYSSRILLLFDSGHVRKYTHVLNTQNLLDCDWPIN